MGSSSLPPARRVRNGPTAALVLRKCGWNVPPDPVRRSLVGATIDAASPPSHHLWGHVLAAAVDRTQRRRAQDVWVGVGELEGSGRAGWVVEGFSDRAGGPAMATAAIFGLLANSSLVVGVLLGLATKPPPRRLLVVVIAFGAEVLVSALTFDHGRGRRARDRGLCHYRFPCRRHYLRARCRRAGAPGRPLPKRTGRDPQDVVPGPQPSPRPPRWRPPRDLLCW